MTALRAATSRNKGNTNQIRYKIVYSFHGRESKHVFVTHAKLVINRVCLVDIVLAGTCWILLSRTITTTCGIVLEVVASTQLMSNHSMMK